MNVEYINPFLTASKDIISQATGLNVNVGKIYVKNAPYTGNKVTVLIGLTGKIRGSVVFSFSQALALKIASAMMCGMPVEALDEMAKSAISELGNMILGNTATIFSKKGISIDITPPTVLVGDNMQLTPTKSTIVCIPLLFDNGEIIEMDISYAENN
ncbi:MAG: chemotaxis protein CheX [Clostridia bacterium]|nr:chemotaxis protein CheX [Clostridia bacterium]